MVDKVNRTIYVDYDNFEEYNSTIMYYLAGCKTCAASIMVDIREKYFKRKNGKPVAVLSYTISIDSEDLLWITLTEPKIILER